MGDTIGKSVMRFQISVLTEDGWSSRIGMLVEVKIKLEGLSKVFC